MSASVYTLVIPTYNRPEDLGRLLRFLAHQKAPFPVLVLDSSRPEIHEQNTAACRELALDLRLERFDPAMPPFEKFWRGAELVRTEFSSLCADDDLVLVSSIGTIVDFLAGNPDCSVAHGWYFNFYLSAGALGLTGIAYRGASVDASDPVDRLHQLFRNYEALTYGVHRTSVLRRVLSHVQSVESMLGRELLGGGLAVIAGKAARLPVLYAGRSLGPSAPYVNWHPVDFLAGSPQHLFGEYVRYRAKLLEYYDECGYPAGNRDELVKLIDLVHLRYLSEYFTPKVLDYMIEQTRKGRSRQEIMGGVWPVLLERGGLEGALQRNRSLRRLRDRFAPWLRGYHIRKITRAHAYRTVRMTSAPGAQRDYHVYPEFDAQLAGPELGMKTESLIGTLADYR